MWENTPKALQFNSRFKQALVNFRVKSFFVTTLVQSKQICSFDQHRRNVYKFDYFGRLEWNQFFPPFNSRTSKCNRRRQLQVTPLLIFWHKTQMKTWKQDKSTSRLRHSLGRLTFSTLKFMRSTCGKSNWVATNRILAKSLVATCSLSVWSVYFNFYCDTLAKGTG